MSSILSDEYQRMAANAICHAATMAGEEVKIAADEYSRPSVMFRPVLQKEGNQWCALLGTNIIDGITGFGDSPANAMWDFDKSWHTPLTHNV